MQMDINLLSKKYTWEWWNDHDFGVRPWNNISFGTVCIQKTSAYTLTAGDHVVLVDSTGGIVTITLPNSVGINGRRYTIKDWKGQSATNNITIATTASETIDGASTKVINQNYVSYTVVSDGANWSIM